MPNLTGTWRLNADQSDRPPTKTFQVRALGIEGLDEVHRPGSGREDGETAHAGFPDWSNVTPSSSLSGEEPIRSRREKSRLMPGEYSLEIAQKGSEITINEGTAYLVRTRTLSTDSRKAAIDKSGTGKNSTVAMWQDCQLVVETKTDRGGKLIETYQLSPSGRQIYVTVEFANNQLSEPITIRRVYDKVEE
jgi:hypothetical protein